MLKTTMSKSIICICDIQKVMIKENGEGKIVFLLVTPAFSVEWQSQLFWLENHFPFVKSMVANKFGEKFAHKFHAKDLQLPSLSLSLLSPFPSLFLVIFLLNPDFLQPVYTH